MGAGDRDRFGWVVEKATELGVTAVIPLETERTAGVASRVRAAAPRAAAAACARGGEAEWRRVGRSGGGAGYAGELAARPLGGKGWVAEGAGAGAGGARRHPLTVVIGPEGGLTPDEIGRLRGAGYRPVSLGPHTLRFETAAIAAAAAAEAARLRGSHG